VKRTLLLNGYPKWIIKNRKKKQHNRSPEFKSKIVLPYSADLEETLKWILERHHIQAFFKPIIKLSTVLASGKMQFLLANVEASFMKNSLWKL